MMMWKNALDHTWRTRVIEATRKFIDLHPKFIHYEATRKFIDHTWVGRHTNTRGKLGVFIHIILCTFCL